MLVLFDQYIYMWKYIYSLLQKEEGQPSSLQSSLPSKNELI